MIAKQACEIRAPDNCFSQAFEIKASAYGAGSVQKAVPTRQVGWESVQSTLVSLHARGMVVLGGSTSIPCQVGVQGTSWEATGDFVPHPRPLMSRVDCVKLLGRTFLLSRIDRWVLAAGG